MMTLVDSNKPYQDITKGEELCGNYGEYKKATIERRRELNRKYCFDCDCKACTMPEAGRQQSDKRRQKYATLDELIPVIGAQDPARALEMAKEAMELLKAQGLGGRMVIVDNTK